MSVEKSLAPRIGCLGFLTDGLVVGAFQTYLYVWSMVCCFVHLHGRLATSVRSVLGLFL